MAGEIDHFNSYTFTRPVKSNSKANVSIEMSWWQRLCDYW